MSNNEEPGSKPMVQESVSQRFTKIWEMATKVGAMLVAAAYVSGFVCVFTFLRTFGIAESSLEIFRAKYLQVGVMFLYFPLCCVLPIAILISRVNEANKKMRNSPRKSEDVSMSGDNFSCWEQISAPLTFCAVNALLIIYIMALFFPGEIFAALIWWLVALLVGTCAAAPLTRFLVFCLNHSQFFGSRIPANSLARSVTTMSWAVTGCSVIILDSLFLQDSIDDIWQVLVKNGHRAGGLQYFGLVIVIPILLASVNSMAKSITDRDERKRSKFELRLIVVPICVVCSYFSMVAFTTYIYPWIPAEKGGGDYSESHEVFVQLSAKPALADLPKSIVKGRPIDNEFGPFVLIEQTDDVLYLAVKKDARGARSWRRFTLGKGFSLPKILQVRREAVEFLRVANRPDR